MVGAAERSSERGSGVHTTALPARFRWRRCAHPGVVVRGVGSEKDLAPVQLADPSSLPPRMGRPQENGKDARLCRSWAAHLPGASVVVEMVFEETTERPQARRDAGEPAATLERTTEYCSSSRASRRKSLMMSKLETSSMRSPVAAGSGTIQLRIFTRLSSLHCSAKVCGRGIGQSTGRD